jgi:hypothetical protein
MGFDLPEARSGSWDPSPAQRLVVALVIGAVAALVTYTVLRNRPLFDIACPKISAPATVVSADALSVNILVGEAVRGRGGLCP